MSQCLVNLPAINELVGRDINKSANTIKTLQNCLQKGTVYWKKESDLYEFVIKTSLFEGEGSILLNQNESLA